MFPKTPPIAICVRAVASSVESAGRADAAIFEVVGKIGGGQDRIGDRMADIVRSPRTRQAVAITDHFDNPRSPSVSVPFCRTRSSRFQPVVAASCRGSRSSAERSAQRDRDRQRCCPPRRDRRRSSAGIGRPCCQLSRALSANATSASGDDDHKDPADTVGQLNDRRSEPRRLRQLASPDRSGSHRRSLRRRHRSNA